ncbi:MAG: serine--tRNA ligase [Candidatus Omnitrophica bacterium]|nr:serine--tRNA ligase [Candidatus Omnitrophota bacterium]MDE2010443.1 serine--tRNA ligase [Candidatus Omnitrophota bacterium]MDE2232316.1 serine--tRNA ligase [Candidatus Omnitrophota bacterium]
MLDLKFIRENPDKVKAGLAAKRVSVDVDALLQLDVRRRRLIAQTDELKAKKNAANEDIGRLIKEKKDPKPFIASMKALAAQIDVLEPQGKTLDEQIRDIMLFIPNIPHESVPKGGAEANQIVSTWGEKPVLNFKSKTHIEIAESLEIIDFKRGTKLSGSNFILYKDLGARLVRALYNFMLDLHTARHGYREMATPVVVNPASMTATGQLPKMKDDMYRLEADDLYLIPTAEVPVTNIHRDEMLDEEDLPLYYTAYTPCFRREAGSYGKDTRGLVRVHQFDKVELVKFVRPETSYKELESLLGNACSVFELLKIPYRVLALASGDLSFAAAKCYDIEVYAAGLDKWLEASSCSNFEDFQARRANISFKARDGKKQGFVHTLNGSGVALPRTMAAILENYQTPDGNVVVPEVLRPYMGGLDLIRRR